MRDAKIETLQADLAEARAEVARLLQQRDEARWAAAILTRGGLKLHVDKALTLAGPWRDANVKHAPPATIHDIRAAEAFALCRGLLRRLLLAYEAAAGDPEDPRTAEMLDEVRREVGA